MGVTILAPENYQYVLFSCILGHFVCNQYLAATVMGARKKYNIPYPNLYAVPGVHEKADAFNRVQRGHQAYFETLTSYMLFAIIGGLKHPLTTAVSGLLYHGGSMLFQVGYADTALDVETARYKKGGALKWVGYFTALGSFISFTGTMAGFWG